LNLILRGHIRSSFEDERLRFLVGDIFNRFDVRMYVQTWNILQNSLSWRRLEEVSKRVCKGFVDGYMRPHLAKKILVMDDSEIVHPGSIEGTIGRTKCPVLGWKNMYRGMLEAAEAVVANEDHDHPTLQMRIDILSNPFSPEKKEILDFIERDYEVAKRDREERIRFLRMRCFLGVDNIYMARSSDMHRFISYMYYNMDRILEIHCGSKNQEHIAFHERRSFFNFMPTADLVNRVRRAKEPS